MPGTSQPQFSSSGQGGAAPKSQSLNLLDLLGAHRVAILGAGLSGLSTSYHLGHPEAAAKIEAAVLADLEAREPGAQRRTPEVGDAIAERVAG